MNLALRYLGLVAAMGLALLGFGDASADQQLVCDMAGRWYPDNDSFEFVSRYISKDGPDTFSGVFSNASVGATANVTGVATNGTWIINLAYTDAGHRGYTKDLVGVGELTRKGKKKSKGKKLIMIKGNFTAKQDGGTVETGTFVINGRCR